MKSLLILTVAPSPRERFVYLASLVFTSMALPLTVEPVEAPFPSSPHDPALLPEAHLYRSHPSYL